MRMRSILICLIVLIAFATRSEAFDLFEVDFTPNLIAWWLHTHDLGLPVKLHTQLYGNPIDKWTVLAAAPVVRIPGTRIDLQVPVGIRLATGDPETPFTHWVGKVNFLGKIGPLDLKGIHDKSWGRNGNPPLFFYKEVISWESVGIRLEGFKYDAEPLPAHLGPMYIYRFSDEHLLQIFPGINLRESKEWYLKVEYQFKRS